MMGDTGQDRMEGRRVALRLIGGDALRPHARLVDCPLKEPLGCPRVPSLRKVGVNDLPSLVDRAVDGGPFPVETTVCLINPPVCTNGTSMSTGSLSEAWQKPLDRAIDGAAVNNQATFRKPLHDVSLAQTVPDVPTHSQGDHIIGKAMVREGAR